MKTIEGTQGKMLADAPMSITPSFSVSATDLPAIKKWSVGKKYALEIEVEMTNIGKDEYMTGQPLHARLKIHKIGTKKHYG